MAPFGERLAWGDRPAEDGDEVFGGQELPPGHSKIIRLLARWVLAARGGSRRTLGGYSSELPWAFRLPWMATDESGARRLREMRSLGGAACIAANAKYGLSQISANRAPREKRPARATPRQEEAGAGATDSPLSGTKCIKMPRGELQWTGEVPLNDAQRLDPVGNFISATSTRKFLFVPCRVKILRKGRRWRGSSGCGDSEEASQMGKVVTDEKSGKQHAEVECASFAELFPALMERGLVQNDVPFIFLSSQNEGLVGLDSVWGTRKEGKYRRVHVCTDTEEYFHMIQGATPETTVYIYRNTKAVTAAAAAEEI